MKGVPFSMGSMQKGYLFYQKWYIKGYGFGPRGGASPYKTLLSTPPGTQAPATQAKKHFAPTTYVTYVCKRGNV